MTQPLPETLIYAPQDLALDLWQPFGNPRGLVVYAHGGGFVHGARDDRIARHYGPLLAGRGFAFASLSYRKGGAPRRVFAPEIQGQIATAAERSLAFYPDLRPGLLGAALYRSAVDFHAAVAFLQSGRAGLVAGLPWVAIGNSAGALAAIGVAHGLDGLHQPAVVSPPARVIGIAGLAPQPWMLSADGPPVALLVARGDQVFPRAYVNRLEQLAADQGLPVTIARIPHGQHTRPVRDVLPDAHGQPGAWGDWLLSQIEDSLPSRR